MAGKQELRVKVIVVGEIGAGKTCIIQRYVQGSMTREYKVTVGVDFAMKQITWDANTNITLQLWDIAGQERYSSMTRAFFQKSLGAFIVVDLTEKDSLEQARHWKEDIDAKVRLPNSQERLPVVLLANKVDLVARRAITTAQIEEFCRAHQISAFFETSALDNLRLDDAVRKLLSLIMDSGAARSSVTPREPGSFRVTSPAPSGQGAAAEQMHGGCC